MKRSLIINTVTAVVFFGSQWYNSRDCKGYPQSLQVFEVLDPYSAKLPPNETWPAIYARFAPLYPYGFCGNSVVDILPLQCCTANLVPEEAGGYRSGMMVDVIDEENLYEFASVEANGGKYCRLIPQSSADVFGYKELYLLNDGSCHEFQLSCFTNGTFAVYPEMYCSGTPTVFEMTEAPKLFTSEILGDFQGTLMKFEKGKALNWLDASSSWIFGYSTILGCMGVFRCCWVYVVCRCILVLYEVCCAKVYESQNPYDRLVAIEQ